MRKIDIKIMKNIRNEFMKDYDKKDLEYIGNYNSFDFADYAFSELYSNSEIIGDMLNNPSLENLCISDGEYGVVEGQYEERFILIRNNNKIPLGLTMNQFNTLDLGFYAWVEYGYFDELGVSYYDLECIEGVDTLFELPYFKRLFIILEKYLAKMGLIRDSRITTEDVDVIYEFNEYFIEQINKQGCMVEAINTLLKK